MGYQVTDLAWLAGFLDGEGTIGLARSNSKRYKHAYLRPHIQAPNTDYRLTSRAAEIVGLVTGKEPSVCKYKMPDGCRDQWRMKVGTQWECAMLIPLLMPYLVGKKEQAQLVLEFCQRKLSRAKYSWYEFKEQDDLAYQQCLALNKRGTSFEERRAAVLKLVKEA